MLFIHVNCGLYYYIRLGVMTRFLLWCQSVVLYQANNLLAISYYEFFSVLYLSTLIQIGVIF